MDSSFPTNPKTWANILETPEIIKALITELRRTWATEHGKLRQLSKSSYEQFSPSFFDRASLHISIVPVLKYNYLKYDSNESPWEWSVAFQKKSNTSFDQSLLEDIRHVHRNISLRTLGFMSPFSGEHGKEILRIFRSIIPHATTICIRLIAHPASLELPTFLPPMLDEIVFGVRKKLKLSIHCRPVEIDLIRKLTSHMPSLIKIIPGHQGFVYTVLPQTSK